MKYFAITVVASLISATLALPYSIAEDESGQTYYLVPLHRERRQTTEVKISPNGVAKVNHQGQIYRDDSLQVNGRAFASKPLHPDGPITVGGNVGVLHESGSALNLAATHTEHRGTNVNAQGKYNLYSSDDSRSRLDAVGTYSRSYGGPWGTSSPNYYGGLQYTYDF